MLRMSVFTNAISLRVFCRMTAGSAEGQRKQLGANTVLKLDASILVTADTSERAKSCRKRTKKLNTRWFSGGKRARAEDSSVPEDSELLPDPPAIEDASLRFPRPRRNE